MQPSVLQAVHKASLSQLVFIGILKPSRLGIFLNWAVTQPVRILFLLKISTKPEL